MQALFFDFDGVLVESLQLKTEAFRRLYAPYGTQVVERVVAHHLAHTGIARQHKIRACHAELLGKVLSEAEVEDLAGTYARMVEDGVVAAPAVAGAEDVLIALHGRVPMFVVSGTPEDELGRIVARRGWAGHFTEVRGSPAGKADILGDLLVRYRLDGGDCLMIGDGRADFDAARELGVPFLGRVHADLPAPFPAGTPTVADLTGLPARLLSMPAPA